MKDVVKQKKTVFVAMSGGVDSSVAALLLKQQGFEVVGVFMKNWSQNIPGTLQCSTAEDQRFARQVAGQLGIPFYTWDFEKEYKALVFDYMLQGYQQGITPNPDVKCNQEIKFGLFLDKALRLGADYIATGHYVRLRRNLFTGIGRLLIPAISAALRPRSQNFIRQLADKDQAFATSGSFRQKDYGSYSFSLMMARDKNKDQSYFLWTLGQKQLQHCLFPIGSYLKPQVRELARKAGLVTATRKDSQGLCFVGKVDFAKFIQLQLGVRPGEIREIASTASGSKTKAIGQHNGLHLFTLGQRQGIGIGGGKPYFVVKKDLKENVLYVSTREHLAEFFPKEVGLSEVNFISPPAQAGGTQPKLPLRVMVRWRYRQPLVKATVISNQVSGSLQAVFEKPAIGITPGQSLVFYQRNKLLGGAVIKPD